MRLIIEVGDANYPIISRYDILNRPSLPINMPRHLTSKMTRQILTLGRPIKVLFFLHFTYLFILILQILLCLYVLTQFML